MPSAMPSAMPSMTSPIASHLLGHILHGGAENGLCHVRRGSVEIDLPGAILACQHGVERQLLLQPGEPADRRLDRGFITLDVRSAQREVADLGLTLGVVDLRRAGRKHELTRSLDVSALTREPEFLCNLVWTAPLRGATQ